MVTRNTTTVGNLTIVDVQDSSNVILLRYLEGESNILEVGFNKGGVYRYFNVPRKDFEAIASADSVGKELRSRVISTNKYIYERVL